MAEGIVSVRHRGYDKRAIDPKSDREHSGRMMGGCWRQEEPDRVGFSKHLDLF